MYWWLLFVSAADRSGAGLGGDGAAEGVGGEGVEGFGEEEVLGVVETGGARHGAGGGVDAAAGVEAPGGEGRVDVAGGSGLRGAFALGLGGSVADDALALLLAAASAAGPFVGLSRGYDLLGEGGHLLVDESWCEMAEQTFHAPRVVVAALDEDGGEFSSGNLGRCFLPDLSVSW